MSTYMENIINDFIQKNSGLLQCKSELKNIQLGDEYSSEIYKLFNGVSGFSPWHLLTHKKQQNVMQAFKTIMQPIAIVDTTLFHSCKNGIAIAKNHISIKGFLEDEETISYSEFCTSYISLGSNRINRNTSYNTINITLNENIYFAFKAFRKYLFENNKIARKNHLIFIGNLIDLLIQSIQSNKSVDISQIMPILKTIHELTPELDNIVNDLSLMLYMYNGQFDLAKDYILDKDHTQLTWNAADIDKYKNHYYNKKYTDLTLQASEYQSEHRYTDAINSYKEALTYKDTELIYCGILDSLSSDASDANNFNVNEYHIWLNKFFDKHNKNKQLYSKLFEYEEKEYQLITEQNRYLHKIADTFVDIILNNRIDIIQEDTKLFDNVDALGMDLVMYAILLNNHNLLERIPRKYRKTRLDLKNILGHNYLNLAALNGFQNFKYILEGYDSDYRSEKLKQTAVKATNFAQSFYHSMLSSAYMKRYNDDKHTYSEAYKSEEYTESEEHMEFVKRLRDNSDQARKEHRESEKYMDMANDTNVVLERLAFERFYEISLETRKSISNVCYNKSKILSEINSINKELHDIRIGIKHITYDEKLLNTTTQSLINKYKEQQVSELSLTKDEFEPSEEFNRRVCAIKVKQEKDFQLYISEKIKSDIEARLGTLSSIKEAAINDLHNRRKKLIALLGIPKLLYIYALSQQIKVIEFTEYNADTELYTINATGLSGVMSIDISMAKRIKKSPERYMVNDTVSIQTHSDNSIDVLHNVKLSILGKEYYAKLISPLDYFLATEE